ncbi:DUF3606 domain-containing protein [Pedobacter mucosus]|uniref:DUF3606 domain-containing protein n=1 Tax=Pedobacter mucosus TaxID=2895286 RepID=UPI001EE4CC10|nr:DUF3606 domain-containing protein [Pedobacter mucosus]UKT62585.1 DUF3606 domain-containing protein [Pedobacter mucosus]
MDYKSIIKSTDKETIDINENFDVENWSERFGVSGDKLKQAVDTVGPFAEEVEKYLNSN